MLISVVIPTYHRNDLLSKCLSGLAPGEQKAIDAAAFASNAVSDQGATVYEVIVSDDGTKSKAEEMIQLQFPWVQWIEGPRLGPAANRNHGANAAKGDWIVFLDDDCVPAETFLRSYADAIGNGRSVLEGKTMPMGRRSRVDMECPINESGGFLWSCNMAIRKDLFSRIGGFDTEFPGAAMEDVDFHTRLLKEGEKIEFVPGALVLHPWRERKGFSFWKLYSKSKRYFIVKHPEKASTVSTSELFSDLGRRLLKQIPPVAWACRGRGLIREVSLTIYTTYALLVYCKGGL